MSRLTVVVPVLNESRNIRRCLEAASPLGPLVVVDSGSTDDTLDIARGLGADVLHFDWDGKFPKKRNWALRNYDFDSEWVLFLDADEVVSPAFVTEVQATLPTTEHVGFWLTFDNFFLGHKLRGGHPFRKLALFRIGAGEYERIEEDNWSHLDMEVHEHPVLDGSVGQIDASIEHNDFRGLPHYIAKHNEYSTWEAARYIKLAGGSQEQLTPRQRQKYRYITRWWFAPAFFVDSFFARRGFLDGARGFHFAALKAMYYYQIRLKIQERQRSDERPNPS